MTTTPLVVDGDTAGVDSCDNNQDGTTCHLRSVRTQVLEEEEENELLDADEHVVECATNISNKNNMTRGANQNIDQAEGVASKEEEQQQQQEQQDSRRQSDNDDGDDESDRSNSSGNNNNNNNNNNSRMDQMKRFGNVAVGLASRTKLRFDNFDNQQTSKFSLVVDIAGELFTTIYDSATQTQEEQQDNNNNNNNNSRHHRDDFSDSEHTQYEEEDDDDDDENELAGLRSSIMAAQLPLPLSLPREMALPRYDSDFEIVFSHEVPNANISRPSPEQLNAYVDALEPRGRVWCEMLQSEPMCVTTVVDAFSEAGSRALERGIAATAAAASATSATHPDTNKTNEQTSLIFSTKTAADGEDANPNARERTDGVNNITTVGRMDNANGFGNVEDDKDAGTHPTHHSFIETVDQIDRDIPRTYPSISYFADPDVSDSLRRVLIALAYKCPNVGYVQGMNFVVAFALLHTKTEDHSLGLISRLMDHPKFALARLYCDGLPQLIELNLLLADLMTDVDPELFAHLDALGMGSLYFAHNWILTLFSYNMPFDTLSLVWDYVFEVGWPALLRVCAVLLMHHREALLQSEFEGCNSIVRRALSCPPVDVVDQAKALRVSRRVQALMLKVVEHGELNSTSTAHAVGVQNL